MECATCHTVDPKVPASTGPSLFGLYGSKVSLQGGHTVIADEDYLHESIVKANAKIVEGYMPVMPSYESRLTKEEVARLVSYMKSL
jgi:cytochrome c oxidase subunit 2